jgi:cysteinyl-tRNA synthetase
MLSIYNTLTKKKEEFKPLKYPDVKMYICGPTVYDYFHIGNARSFIMSDIMRRYLEYRGFNVSFVMNITDIDDKIIKKASAEKKDTKEIADFYTAAFLEDIEKLKIKPATAYPKATEHIPEIITMITSLEEKGIAYNVNGNIFFDISKFKEYGKLSGKKIDELESGSRIEINTEKKNPLDFSLWKKAKEGEPAWNSPWGKGRPGWHIECSAMSCKHFGETFDIHAGGNDLIFPHHENEIAQSEGANGKPFVNYWVHFGFLNINSEKMSKSLGNFFTTRDILKSYSTEAIRLLFSQTHYAGPLNFSSDLLDSSEKALEKFKNLLIKIEQELKLKRSDGVDSKLNIKNWENKFISVMDDDFNTPQGVAVLFDFIKEVNKVIAEKEKLSPDFYMSVRDFLTSTAMNIFGMIDMEKENLQHQDKTLETELIDLLINIREEAKKEKNFLLADKIRSELKEIGILLQDSKEGTSFNIKRS